MEPAEAARREGCARSPRCASRYKSAVGAPPSRQPGSRTAAGRAAAGASAAPSRIMEFLSDKFGLKSPPAAAGKSGDFYLAPGAPLEHVMEALDGGEAFYAKGGGKCVGQAAYAPHGRLERTSPARDGSGKRGNGGGDGTVEDSCHETRAGVLFPEEKPPQWSPAGLWDGETGSD